MLTGRCGPTPHTPPDEVGVTISDEAGTAKFTFHFKNSVVFFTTQSHVTFNAKTTEIDTLHACYWANQTKTVALSAESKEIVTLHTSHRQIRQNYYF